MICLVINCNNTRYCKTFILFKIILSKIQRRIQNVRWSEKKRQLNLWTELYVIP